MDPKSPPSTTDTKLLVSCDSWHEFVSHFASDLATGGMYVETENAPAVMSVVDVCLRLPESTEILLRGRIVQVLSAEQAGAVGKAGGIGLELIELDADRKRQIVQLIEFARWQGATNDPHASFSRTLLEVSQPMAPAEVGHRLSMLPAPQRKSDGPRTRSSSGVPVTTSKRAPAKNSQPVNVNAEPKAARGSRPNMSAVVEPSGGTGSRPNMSAVRPGSSPSNPASGSQSRLSAIPDAAANPPEPALPPQAKPTDQVKLKLVLTNFAHKHYDAALRVTLEMLADNPGDRQALRWQHMCNARMALSRSEPAAACDAFEQALLYDADNREAREFVRNFRRDQKLNSLPFGRYFTKKK